MSPEKRLSPGEALQHPWIVNIARKLQRSAAESDRSSGNATGTSTSGHNGHKMLSQLSISQSNLRATADRRNELRTHGEHATEIKPPNRGSFYSAGSSSFSYNTELPPSLIDSASPLPMVTTPKKAGHPHRKSIVHNNNANSNGNSSNPNGHHKTTTINENESIGGTSGNSNTSSHHNNNSSR